MKVIVAGSRSLAGMGKVNQAWVVSNAMDTAPWDFSGGEPRYPGPLPVDTIIHGGAKGVDQAAQRAADARGIDTEVYEPNYEKFTRRSAPIARNQEMASEGDALLAIWDGESNGTRDMVDKALDEGLDVYVHTFEP